VRERVSLLMVVVTATHKELGVRAEFERMRKMESENKSENDHFCLILDVIFKFIFEN
jgi:hypothetical protein